MKKPSIENLIKHNEKIIDKCKDMYWLDLYESEEYSIPRAMGWIDALNYINNNYKLEEK